MNLIVLGATSPIAQATVRRLAAGCEQILLLARDPERLRPLCQKLGDTQCSRQQIDLADTATLPAAREAAAATIGPDTIFLIAAGNIEHVDVADHDGDAAARLIDVNFRNIVSFATPIIERMREAGGGTVVVISSVAGERGRQSNFVYGAAKAGLTTWADGLRHRLWNRGVHVITVIPGYIDTPMLRSAIGDAADRLPRFLVGTPEHAAGRIVRAIRKRTPRIWIPRTWRLIMAVIHLLPERIFVRSRL